jgi:hypothetical protein
MSRNSRKVSKVRKPFTRNDAEKNAQLHNALRNVQDAIDALANAGVATENWGEYETIKHFENELSEFLSCDSGEAGFEPYLIATAK